MANDKLLSVRQSAELLGISRQRIQALITEGRLLAQKIGNTYVVQESSLELIKIRKTGRPKKQT